MNRSMLVAVIITAGHASAAHAVPTVTAGEHVMDTNSVATFDILVTPGPAGNALDLGGTDGNEQTMFGVDLYLLVGGGSNGPIITSIDFTSGTLWGANQGGNITLGIDPPGRDVARATYTIQPAPNDEIPMNGVLARVTFDSTGIVPGQYTLGLTNFFGTTDFAIAPGFDAKLIDGHITITPEPSSIVMGLLGAIAYGAVALRCRRKSA